MNRNKMLAALAAIASLSIAGSAGAGGIIIELREARLAQGGPYEERLNGFGNPMGITAAVTHGGNGSSGSNSEDGSSSNGTGKRVPNKFGIGDPTPVEQLIRQGLVTEEEALVGCGGASAATGPAGFAPLLLTGLALLRRRR